MGDLSASAALAALVTALDGGDLLSLDDSEVLTKIQVRVAPIPDELVVKLRKPVTIAGVTYEELRLHEPTAAEWTGWSKLGGVEGDIKAVSVVAGVPESAVRQIGARDLLDAAGYIGRFLR